MVVEGSERVDRRWEDLNNRYFVGMLIKCDDAEAGCYIRGVTSKNTRTNKVFMKNFLQTLCMFVPNNIFRLLYLLLVIIRLFYYIRIDNTWGISKSQKV